MELLIHFVTHKRRPDNPFFNGHVRSLRHRRPPDPDSSPPTQRNLRSDRDTHIERIVYLSVTTIAVGLLYYYFYFHYLPIIQKLSS